MSAKRFLDLLDPTANKFRFRTFNEAADVPKDHGHKFHSTLANSASALETDNRVRRGVFVVINSGGDTDDRITHIRAAAGWSYDCYRAR